MSDHLIGISAHKFYNNRLKTDPSAKSELGFFVGLVSTQEVTSVFAAASATTRLQRTIVLERCQILEALKYIKLCWETIFDRTKHHLLSWVILCRAIYASNAGKTFLQTNMLQKAGSELTTACRQGVLLAKFSSMFLVAIALMDGAVVQLSHTHQKDIIVRFTGIRMEIILTQQGGTCYASLARHLSPQLQGTYPLYEDVQTFINTGQSWTSMDGLTCQSSLHHFLSFGGFCSADQDFLSLGFLSQQFITHTVASQYLRLAVEAYEFAFLHFDLPQQKHQAQTISLSKKEMAMSSLTELISCEFYDKMGRPSSRRLQAQLHAIQSQAWVPYIMESYQGVRNTTKRPNPPRFTSHDVVTKGVHISTHNDQQEWTDYPDLPRQDDCKGSLETTFKRRSSIPMQPVQSNEMRTNLPIDINPQAAAAWLVSWSICRVLAHVQILPAFLGSHVSDTECWLD